MFKSVVVLKHEFFQIVKKKSFFLMTLLLPLLMTALMILPKTLAHRGEQQNERLAIIDCESGGVADELAKALAKYTKDKAEDPLYTVTDILRIPVKERELYKEAYERLSHQIAEKEIIFFIVIMPEAHLNESNLFMVSNSDNFRTLRRLEDELSAILSSRRLGGKKVDLPVSKILELTKEIKLTIKNTRGESIPFMIKFMAATIYIMMMYSMIMTYGVTLMRSIIEEKNSRVMEVLISSISPFQLMLGKVLGLGAAAFTQFGIWVGIGTLFYFAGKTSILRVDIPLTKIVFNPIIAGFFVLFFVGGYLMFSSIFALIGSIVNSDKEAQHYIFPVSFLLLLPVMVGFSVAQNPYAAWVQIASYIPFFAPTLMMMRVMLIVPSTQICTSIVAEASFSLLLVFITDIILVWITARVFRVGILMYGKQPTFKEILRWIRY